MVQIATPVSDLLCDEQAGQKIIELSDCLEGRDRHIDTKWPNQKLFHFSGSLIWRWDESDKELIRKAVSDRTELEFVTFHLDSCYHKPQIADSMYQPTGKPYTREDMLENARENTAWLRSFLPQKVSIGVENNNYFPTPAYDIVTSGDFITEVVQQNGLEFLFDMAHARITAHNTKVPYETYLSSLPMERVTQLHLSSHQVSPKGRALDSHDIPTELVIKEARSLIQRFPVKYVGIEHYRSSQSLIEGLTQIQGLK